MRLLEHGDTLTIVLLRDYVSYVSNLSAYESTKTCVSKPSMSFYSAI